MTTAQLTIVNLENTNSGVGAATSSTAPTHSRYRLDDRTRQLGIAGLASARAILAEAAQRRDAAHQQHAQAA